MCAGSSPRSPASAPSMITDNPSPPASTTPASRSTGSSVGVRATDSRDARYAASHVSSTSPPLPAACWAASASSRMTVSMVPSTGLATAP